MSLELLTRQDLLDFKAELFNELKKLLLPPETMKKKFLRSSEVRQALGISPGTLQNLRSNGTLRYARIGGIIFYDADEVEKLLKGGRTS